MCSTCKDQETRIPAELSSVLVVVQVEATVAVVEVVVVVRAVILVLMYTVNDPSDTGIFTFHLFA